MQDSLDKENRKKENTLKQIENFMGGISAQKLPAKVARSSVQF